MNHLEPSVISKRRASMEGFTYRQFIKLQLDNGLYRVGFHTSKFIDKINQKLVRVLCDDWHTDLEEGDIFGSSAHPGLPLTREVSPTTRWR